VRLRNLWLVLLDQLPLRRLLRNAWRGHLRGILHVRSHVRNDGAPKVAYNTKASAERAAAAMRRRSGDTVWYSNYKCLHCDGYHVGRNRDSLKPHA
jgi:hypothetical protein